MLITHEKFLERGGFKEVTADDFEGLLARAKTMVDAQIGYDVEAQNERGFVSERSFNFYVDAIVAQIEYIHFVGIKQIAGMRESSNVKIGNFSYSAGQTKGGGLIENTQFGNQVIDYLLTGGFIGGAVNVNGY